MKKVKSFFNMKKWVLGALACAALVLMMPGEAKAAAMITHNGNLAFVAGTSVSSDLNNNGY